MLLLKPLLLAASAAAIVIPELSESDEGIFRALPVDETTNRFPLQLHVQVPCEPCEGRHNEILLDFNVRDERDLMLNGFPLFPGLDSSPPGLGAVVSEGDGSTNRQSLGFFLAVRPVAMDEDQLFEILEVHFQVMNVGNRPVEGLPPVKIKLIKAPTGEIALFSAEVVKADENKTHNDEIDNGSDDKISDDKPCVSLLCRFKKLFGHTWKDIKGSHKGCGGMRAHGSANGGRKRPHGKPQHKNGGHRKGGHRKGGHRKGGHHHHNGDNYKADRHHSWMKTIKTVTSDVVIPILLGIGTGVSVAFLTVSIGSLVLRLIRSLRGDQGEDSLGGSHKASVTEETMNEDEKSDLLANQDAPPEYEEERPQN